MRKVKKKGFRGLTKKQLDVIEDIFESNLNEIDVIKTHNVSKRVYRKWLEDDQFVDELAFRINTARRQSDMIIARCAPNAAEKLVELAKSDKEETSRRACLDIISHRGAISSPKVKKDETGEKINTEAAEKLLAALAREERGKNV